MTHNPLCLIQQRNRAFLSQKNLVLVGGGLPAQ